MDVHAWIERALLRVETLETERALCATSEDPRAALRTIEIDAEIETLVEALEAAADDAEAQAGAPALVGATTLAEPVPRSDDTAPMHVGVALPMMADDEPIALPRRRWVLPAAVAAVLVLVVGGGAAVASSGDTKADTTAVAASAAGLAAAVPEQVIAAEVPPDTQEPDAAVGADVDVTPPTAIPEPVAASADASKARAATSGERRGKKRKKKIRRKAKKATKQRQVAFGRSRDPLAGMK